MNISISQFLRQNDPQGWLDSLVDEMLRDHKNQVVLIGTVLAVVKHPNGSKLVVPGLNIVTVKGNRYYAEKAMAQTPYLDFKGANNGLRLGTSATAPTAADNDVTAFITGSGLAVDATYPMTNDTDADNTGAGVTVMTWRYSYTAASFANATINEGAIVDAKASPTGALSHFLFSAQFAKTTSDTLKVIVNHTVLGV